MIIFSDSLFNSVPKSNIFYQVIANSVVWHSKWESCKCQSIDSIKTTHYMVISSREGGNIKLVSSEELIGLVNVVVTFFPIFINMVLQLVHINIRHPTVNIHDSQIKILGAKIQVLKFGLHLLSAPTYIRSFAFVLIFPQLMQRVIDLFKLGLKLIDKFLGFDVWTLFVFFHS